MLLSGRTRQGSRGSFPEPTKGQSFVVTVVMAIFQRRKLRPREVQELELGHRAK